WVAPAPRSPATRPPPTRPPPTRPPPTRPPPARPPPMGPRSWRPNASTRRRAPRPGARPGPRPRRRRSARWSRRSVSTRPRAWRRRRSGSSRPRGGRPGTARWAPRPRPAGRCPPTPSRSWRAARRDDGGPARRGASRLRRGTLVFLPGRRGFVGAVAHGRGTVTASAVVGRQAAQPRVGRFGPASRAVLWGAGLFLASLVGLEAYRFTLPTDGWRLAPP